jgi:hypothetical protein
MAHACGFFFVLFLFSPRKNFLFHFLLCVCISFFFLRCFVFTTSRGSRVNERPAVRRGSGSTIKKFQRKKKHNLLDRSDRLPGGLDCPIPSHRPTADVNVYLVSFRQFCVPQRKDQEQKTHTPPWIYKKKSPFSYYPLIIDLFISIIPMRIDQLMSCCGGLEIKYKTSHDGPLVDK